MEKIIVTVLGKDRPGIIALISGHLYNLDCNLENVNQMILQNEFAGFFIVDLPENLNMEAVEKELSAKANGQGLNVYVNRLDTDDATDEPITGETFFITTIGPDQKGLVARFSGIMARFNANITNLKAVFKGGDDPMANIMSYQIDIGPDIDKAGLFEALKAKGRELNLDVRIQHKNIFNVTNKI
ncbi:MAG: amino acid-binding protein [Desulfobacteraceae bacterium]|nr:MAG: amino acid-binding protein [Desulfobacteraceae bacterium]